MSINLSDINLYDEIQRSDLPLHTESNESNKPNKPTEIKKNIILIKNKKYSRDILILLLIVAILIILYYVLYKL
jgi:hypothetical protein